MATQANAATAKDATTTNSPKSVLREEAPQLRTAESIHRKQEQVVDGLEHGVLTAKQAEQLNMAIKGLWRAPDLEMRWMSMLLKFGKAKVPPPRTPLLRSVLGLTGEPSKEERESYGELAAAR